MGEKSFVCFVNERMNDTNSTISLVGLDIRL